MIPKHCASGPIIPWQCHQFPESCFSPFHPCLPGASAGKGGDCRCFWRVMAWLAGAQPARCVPVAARHVCWCVLTVLARAPCSAPDWCWACVTLCHAAQSTLMPYHCALKAGLYLSQEGYLDIWPLPSFLGGRALAHRSLPALTAFCPCHLGLALSPFPLCPSFLLGHTGWWVTWRALGQAGL